MAITRLAKKRKTLTSLFDEDLKPWADLHNHLVFMIFSHLSPEDLFFSVSLVCNSWRLICWEVLFRQDPRIIDLTPLKSLVRRVCHYELPWIEDTKYHEKLLNAMECMLESPLKEGQDIITTVVFPLNMHISGLEELAFIANRTPNVRRLVLCDGYELKQSCFSEALRHWKFMEELFIGPVYSIQMTNIIQQLGINCKNLSKLEIHNRVGPARDYFKLDFWSANLIANHLKKLKEFSISHSEVHKEGVKVMLRECKQVMKLSFNDCCGLTRLLYYNGIKFLIDRQTEHNINVDIMKEIVINDDGSECLKWCVDGLVAELITTEQVLERYFSKEDGEVSSVLSL